MIRTCDGTDENLVRYEHAAADCPDFPACKHFKPCDCGLTFDDVDHMVIHPHQFIPSPEERRRLVDAYLAAVESGSSPGVLRNDLTIGS